MRRAPKDRADRRIKFLCYTRPLHYSLLTNTQSKSSFSILKLTILILAYLIYLGHWGCADKGAINVGLHIVVIKGQCIAMVLKLPLHIVIIEVNTVNIRSGNLLESLPYHYHHHGPQMYTVDISNSDSAIYIVHTHRPYTIYLMPYTMYNVQYTMYNVQYTMYNVQYTIYHVQCTIYHIILNINPKCTLWTY